MTLEQIKKAVDEGKTVHWHHTGYTVIKDRLGQYLIGWNIGGHDENYTGLTEDYMRPQHNKFFIAGKKTVTISYQGNEYEVDPGKQEAFVVKTRRKRTMCRSEGSTYLSRITSPRKLKKLLKMAWDETKPAYLADKLDTFK